jgi:hypothetical protein
VDVTITRPHRATVRRTLTGPPLRTLAAFVNGLAPAPPPEAAFWACLERPKLAAVDRLSFVAPGHTIAVRVTVDDCLSRAVRVTANGKTQPGLTHARRLDRVVIAALGLSPRYLLG